jgi:catalase
MKKKNTPLKDADTSHLLVNGNSVSPDDSLHLSDTAPADNSHLPDSAPTPPGKQPTAPGSLKDGAKSNDKIQQLEAHRKHDDKRSLTTNQGTKIADDQNSLKMGSRGPTLLEDFIMREKITHFDHERIPERIVHARGSAAHGYFELYKSLADIRRTSCNIRACRPLCLFVSPRYKDREGRLIPFATFAAGRQNSTPNRVFSTSWVITLPSSLFRTP